ncbi:MAG TPA: aminotransferase class III-fold pyridoxal phosphate-dependent enzyme [Sorangium sp.]|nr:aminotransferase class III-fold pyridoxal phosphate-dependent enzyme [Sorangium sp.]
MNDSSDSLAYRQLVKPRLAESLATMGLDVIYHRAQGDHVYLRDQSGKEIEVLDMVGGNGSLLFGHNHPRVIADLREALADGMVVHAQLSIRREAGLLAETLVKVARRDSGIDEGFVVHFANSGAEAIECAMKHAEVTRMSKLLAAWDALRPELEEMQRAARAGEVSMPEGQLEHASIASKFGRVRSLEELVGRVLAHNQAQLTRRPIFVGLEHAFHGRLVASVQLTYAARPPYRNLGLNVRFLPLNSLDALEALKAELSREESLDLYGLKVEDGAVRLYKRSLSAVAGVLVEPIQGEAGVLEVSSEFGAALRRFCDEQGCPLILDEIQSGMGRTGRFFAASCIGLKGDYYVLGKSLGGGVAKITAVMFRASLYQHDFALHHSSTFSEDDLSCRAARTALEILEENSGATYRHIEATGRRLRAALERVHASYPELTKEVRGRGLFLALEFFPPLGSGSPLLRTLAQYKLFGYLLSGYLLKAHQIRIAPTGSATNLLRFHPSINLDDRAIESIEVALRRLCDILRHEDIFHLIFPLTNSTRPVPRTEVRDFRPARGDSTKDGPPGASPGLMDSRLSLEGFRKAEPSLADLTDGEVGAFLSRLMEIGRRVGSLQHRQV